MEWQERITMNRFAVLGRVGMDLYADPPGSDVASASAFFPAIGGSAGNIAVALARQGAGAALLSRVSDDAVGRYCLDALAGYGVAVNHVAKSGGQTRTSLAVTETRLAPATVLYRNDAADFALADQDIATIDFAAFGALIVTGTALAAEPSRSATLLALDKARATGALCVLDIDHRRYSWASDDEARLHYGAAVALSDVVIGNDEEFALLAGSSQAALTYAQGLAQGRAFVVFKKGPDGATTFVHRVQIETPIYRVDALKPMGSGDGFMGGLMAALARGLPLNDALSHGAATAAIIVAGIGCAPASPDLAALRRFMKDHHAHPAP